jgi:hypothetical protein
MTPEELDSIKQALNELKQIKETEPNEALECLEVLFSNVLSTTYTRESSLKDFNIVKQALLKAQENERVIHAIEQYIDMRLAVEPLDDVAKAFKEIKQQLQIIKECK